MKVNCSQFLKVDYEENVPEETSINQTIVGRLFLIVCLKAMKSICNDIRVKVQCFY